MESAWVRQQIPEWFKGQAVIYGLLLALLSILLSLAITTLVVARWPEDQFLPRAQRAPAGAERWRGQLLAALLGGVLIIVGALLALPGIPGQGLLLIVAGLSLLPFPGRLALLRRLLERPTLLAAVNRLRARLDRPPLRLR